MLASDTVTIAMVSRTTVAPMPRTKRVDQKCIAAVANAVREIVERDFGGKQTAAAKALKVSQGHLSHVLRSGDRGPGLPFLIALREYTGRSIDSLLGFEGDETDAERLARAVLAGRHRSPASEPPLLPPKGHSDGTSSRPRRR